MRQVKSTVVTLVLLLAGAVYASADGQSAAQKCVMAKAATCCKTDASCCSTGAACCTQSASCCKEGSACEADSSCCTEGASCCASDSRKAGAVCCSAKSPAS